MSSNLKTIFSKLLSSNSYIRSENIRLHLSNCFNLRFFVSICGTIKIYIFFCLKEDLYKILVIPSHLLFGHFFIHFKLDFLLYDFRFSARINSYQGICFKLNFLIKLMQLNFLKHKKIFISKAQGYG